MLSKPSAQALILEAEETFGKRSPFDSIYKLESIIRKSKHCIDRIMWCLSYIIDSCLNQHVRPGEYTLANLSGKGKKDGIGLLDLYLLKHDFRQAAQSQLLTGRNYSAEDTATISKILADPFVHSSHRGLQTLNHVDKVSNVTWLGAMQGEAREYFLLFESIIYSSRYDVELKGALLKRVSPQELLETDLSEQWKPIQDQCSSKHTADTSGDQISNELVAPGSQLSMLVAKNLLDAANLKADQRDFVSDCEQQAKQLVSQGTYFVDGSLHAQQIINKLQSDNSFCKKSGGRNQGNILILYDVKANKIEQLI